MNAKTYDVFGQRCLARIEYKLKHGWSAHLARDGRIYYCNHGTQTSSWLPPADSWDYKSTGLPYGWETAVDKEGKSYYINHLNKTTTYEDPRKESLEEPPQPRQVELFRDAEMGFGFVAGSEKPVIVRFVTDGGPSESKLLPGDQILKVNGEDVKLAPRDHVIELVRACKLSVILIVCQPHTDNSTRKSALLSAAKKARLKTNPSRVRFAEGVVINGSPLFSPSNFSGESCVPFMPNVLKVFLENGQTKSFKYDSSTTVQDVLESLQQKLSILCIEHFSLVVEHIKSLRRNKLTLLDPKESLAKIAARPGAQHLRCLFRVTFVPKDAYEMLREDCVAFEYLYTQCCNDVVQERFAPELKYDIALRLATLHMQQHALAMVASTNPSTTLTKISVKALEKECGLDKFVPVSLMETMKRKELRKLLSHFIKLNHNLCTPDQKMLTALQAKLHYLRIIGELPSYGAKCFATNLRDSNTETIILVSPKFGISKIVGVRNSVPLSLSSIEDLSGVVVTREDELSHQVELQMKDIDRENILLSMEDRDAEELVLLLQGYYRLLAGRSLSVQRECDRWVEDAAPSYHTRHLVREAGWNYPALPDSEADKREFSVDLATSPPLYHPSKPVTANGHVSTGTRADSDNGISMGNSRPVVPQPPKPILPSSMVDWNMNRSSPDNASSNTEPVISTLELLEDAAERASARASVLEARNKEALRRVAEMQRIVQTAEMYLTETEAEEDEEETESVQGSDKSGNVGVLKAADSLLLLTQVGLTPPTIDPSVVLGAAARFRLSADVSGDHSESDDTDSLSTPSDSPSHRIKVCSSKAGPPTRPPPPPPAATPPPTPPPTLGINGSSFGLHSPDGIPLEGVVSNNNCNGGQKGIRSNGHGPSLRLSVQDYLQKLHRESRLPYQFAEGTLYLDPDIIDLTMIPPPMTPDHEDAAPVPATPVNFPPTPFADRQSLAAELELLSIDSESNLMGLYSLQAKRQHAPLATSEDAEDSDIGSSSTRQSSAIWTPQDNLDIESFIASVTVPPPPIAMLASMVTEATPPPSVQALSADELTAFIIPPPPFGTMYEDDSGEEVISRLQAATASVRLVVRGENTCGNENNNKNNNNNNSNSSFSDNSSTISSEIGGAQADTEEDALDAASFRSSPAPALTLSRLRTNQASLGNYMGQYLVPGSRSPSYVDANGCSMFNGLDITSSSDDGHPEPRISSSHQRMASLATLRPRGPRTARPMASYLDTLQWEHSGSSDNIGTTNRMQRATDSEGIRRIAYTSTSTRTESSHSQTSTLTRRFPPVKYENEDDDDTEDDSDMFYESESQRTGTILRSPSKNNCKPHQIGGNIVQPIANKPNGTADVNGGMHHPGGGRTVTTMMASAGTRPLGSSSSKQASKNNSRRDSFYGAEEVIGNLLVHLENTLANSSIMLGGHTNERNLITARDTLVTISRQFVNASKLFVKSATESEDRLVESLVTCLELMQRMFALTEQMVSGGGAWQVHTKGLVLKVKDVALTFLQTLQAASEAVGRPMNDPKLLLLMQQATTLAAVLTALMRTLRGIVP